MKSKKCRDVSGKLRYLLALAENIGDYVAVGRSVVKKTILSSIKVNFE